MAENNKLNTKILLLTGTSDQYAQLATYVLALGEPAVEFVPGANTQESKDILTAVKIKIGDGVTPIADLPYVGDDVKAELLAKFNGLDQELDALTARVKDLEDDVAELKTTVSTLGNAVFEMEAAALTDIEGSTEADKIAAYLAVTDSDLVVKEGNIAIVKTLISAEYTTDSETIPARYSYTAYAYNGEAWAAMDGNYNAENVIFNEDLTYTSAIGVMTVPSTGSGTISAKGKSLEAVLKSIIAKRVGASVKTDASADLSSSNIGSKEVGTNIEVAYSFTTNAGKYTYGPATGVTFSDASATFNGETKTGTSGKFTSVQVTDTTNLSLSGTIKQSAGAVPNDNLGDPDSSAQIAEHTYNFTGKGTLSGYRGWFYGYKAGGSTVDPATLTSAQVRALGSGVKTSFPGTLATTNMQQMFFAAPKGKVKSVAVEHSVNGAPQTVKGPITVYVKGANDYVAAGDETTNGGMAYDLFYVSNDNANTGAATYKITTTKA